MSWGWQPGPAPPPETPLQRDIRVLREESFKRRPDADVIRDLRARVTAGLYALYRNPATRQEYHAITDIPFLSPDIFMTADYVMASMWADENHDPTLLNRAQNDANLRAVARAYGLTEPTPNMVPPTEAPWAPRASALRRANQAFQALDQAPPPAAPPPPPPPPPANEEPGTP